jgi:HEPN domain-containing protein
MRSEPAGEGQRWLAQAENDLAFAELAARERFFAQACFNSQQAAEKALKAFLQFYLSTRYPTSLPGGIPAEAFGQEDSTRAPRMGREVVAAVGRSLR